MNEVVDSGSTVITLRTQVVKEGWHHDSNRPFNATLFIFLRRKKHD